MHACVLQFDPSTLVYVAECRRAQGPLSTETRTPLPYAEPQAGGAAEQRQPFAETLRHLQDTTAAHAAAGGGGGGPPDAATSKLLEALTAAMGQQAGGEGGEGGMDAFVDSMMSQLLCKDVLYEPMKVRTLWPLPLPFSCKSQSNDPATCKPEDVMFVHLVTYARSYRALR